MSEMKLQAGGAGKKGGEIMEGNSQEEKLCFWTRLKNWWNYMPTIAKAEKIILLSIILTAVNIAIALLRLTKRL